MVVTNAKYILSVFMSFTLLFVLVFINPHQRAIDISPTNITPSQAPGQFVVVTMDAKNDTWARERTLMRYTHNVMAATSPRGQRRQNNVTAETSPNRPRTDNVTAASSHRRPRTDNVTVASLPRQPRTDNVTVASSPRQPRTNIVTVASSTRRPQIDNVTVASSPRRPRTDNVAVATSHRRQWTVPPYITASCAGRLGNQMFEYAMLYSTAKALAWKPYRTASCFRKLNKMFGETLTVPVLTFSPENTITVPGSKDPEKMLGILRSLPNKNISLNGLFQSHIYFRGFSRDIRREFISTKDHQAKARSFFSNITPSEWHNTTFTRVGIHVRRGDIASTFIMPPSQYFRDAMEYFRNRFGRVQFIVTSADMEWSMENIRGPRVVYSERSSPIDFAILTLCDHVIISVGTFSWWAGWLSMGITVYHGVEPPAGSYMARLYDNGNWIPPNDIFNEWIPFT